MPKYACRKDTTHNPIAEVFERNGYSVLDMSRLGGGAPDMAVGKDGMTYFIEAKSRRGAVREGQQTFFETWKGRVYICRSEIEALAIIQEIEPMEKVK